MFPWRRLMIHGLHELHLAPAAFWQSTLRELVPVAATDSLRGFRQCLSEMMARWPDEEVS